MDSNGDRIVGRTTNHEDTRASVGKMVDKLFAAASTGTGSYSFTMTPMGDNGGVQIAESDPDVSNGTSHAGLGVVDLCIHCRSPTCAWVEHGDSLVTLGNAMEEMTATNVSIRKNLHIAMVRKLHGVCGGERSFPLPFCVTKKIFEGWPKKSSEEYYEHDREMARQIDSWPKY